MGIWTSTGPSQGAYALAIDPMTPATVYVGTYYFGVFKSTNGGGSWTAVNTGLPAHAGFPSYLAYVRALAIDPTTPTTLYAGTDCCGVFKSTTGGGNWTAMNTGLTNYDVHTLAIDPTTPTTLYAGTDYGTAGGGVFKSTDGGGNWTGMDTGLTDTLGDVVTPIYALLIDPTAPTTLYAETERGVFKSTDGGGNWTAMNTGLHLDLVLAIDRATPTTLYADSGGRVFKSTDGGGSWMEMNTGIYGSVIALVIDPATPTTLYAGAEGFRFGGQSSGGGVFKSTNGGASWTAMNTGFDLTDVYALAIDPTTPTTLYAGMDRGVFDFEFGATASTTTSTSTSTSISTPTSTSTTTTLPCTNARCSLDVSITSPACSIYTVPSSVTAKFSQATSLIERAGTSPAKEAKKLLKRAKMALTRAKTNARHAAKGTKPKISPDCAAALKDSADRVLATL